MSRKSVFGLLGAVRECHVTRQIMLLLAVVIPLGDPVHPIKHGLLGDVIDQGIPAAQESVRSILPPYYRILALADKETLKEMYLPQFVNEMKHSDEALAKLAYLFDADKVGKKICLLCFCSDESLCHRSIIAGFLQAAGCDVKLVTNNDYRKYYDLFVNA